MKFPAYSELLTRNFAPGVPHFYRVSDRNVLKKKGLRVARGLHSLWTWEELAEDPFRGLRAGPADFSPSSFQVSVSTSADGVPEASEYTNPSTPRTTEHGRGVFCHETKSESRSIPTEPEPSVALLGMTKVFRYADAFEFAGTECDGTGTSWLRLGSGWRVV